MTTTIECKEIILTDLWRDFKSHPTFADFMAYNDLGLPLAYAVSTSIVQRTESSEQFVSDTFALFLEALEVEDKGFTTLEEVFEASPRMSRD